MCYGNTVRRNKRLLTVEIDGWQGLTCDVGAMDDAIYGGDHKDTEREGPRRTQQRNGAALNSHHHILRGGHGHDDGDIKHCPEGYAPFAFVRKQAVLAEIMLSSDQQHHRDADPADIGFDTDQNCDEFPDENPSEVAGGKKRRSRK
jgi:hypothetical protein